MNSFSTNQNIRFGLCMYMYISHCINVSYCCYYYYYLSTKTLCTCCHLHLHLHHHLMRLSKREGVFTILREGRRTVAMLRPCDWKKGFIHFGGLIPLVPAINILTTHMHTHTPQSKKVNNKSNIIREVICEKEIG